ncbi:unnamed protein product [Urochloa humidicola]
MSSRREDAAAECSCCKICTYLVIPLLIALFLFFLAVYAFLIPVRVTVSDASLARFALLNNGTAAALAYDLSLTVAVRNPNWAMRAEHAAPAGASWARSWRTWGAGSSRERAMSSD